jgi:HAMP domain-containing protein
VAQKTEALKLANDEASRSAIEGAVLLGVLVTVALLSLGFLSRSLQRDVLGRLTEVGHVTEAIAAGDRRRRVRDFYQDELGLVARQLNAALDRQHELESQMQGRLLEQRRVLVGLLNQWPTPAAMIGIDGELVASTLTVDDEAELHRLTPRVRMAAKVLMTRRFVKAEELAADIKASDGNGWSRSGPSRPATTRSPAGSPASCGRGRARRSRAASSRSRPRPATCSRSRPTQRSTHRCPRARRTAARCSHEPSGAATDGPQRQRAAPARALGERSAQSLISLTSSPHGRLNAPEIGTTPSPRHRSPDDRVRPPAITPQVPEVSLRRPPAPAARACPPRPRRPPLWRPS